jgi:NADH-quinone oxidoreductase subunit A
MVGDYAPILIHFLAVLALVTAILGISAWVGVHRSSPEKLAPYECGIPSVGDARERFSIAFFLIGLDFILFDVETAFLYPWAVVYKDLKWFGFFAMLLYVLILAAGYVYAWKKGALDWSR